MRTASPGSLCLQVVLLALATTVCSRPSTEVPYVWTEEQRNVLLRMSLPLQGPTSPSNSYANLDEAAELGHSLFFDAALSADGSTSCASCHKPSLYFTDGQPTAVGLQPLARHTPSVVFADAFPFVMWDGRNDSLWSQALGPLEDPAEMGSHRLLVLSRIANAYRSNYERVFGPLPALPRGLENMRPEVARELWEETDVGLRGDVTSVFVNVGKALEAYQRRLRTEPAPFDEYVEALRSGDASGGGHLTPEALRGLRAFLGEANCINCHNGPLFTDMAFHNLGLPSHLSIVDEGRAAGIVRLLEGEFRSDGPHADGAPNPQLAFVKPRFTDAIGAFKTPSLRNVARTAPYGHGGQFANLDEVLRSYREDRPPALVGHRDPILNLVSKDFDVEDMQAFLESLTGQQPRSKWWVAPTIAACQDPAH